MTISKDPDLVAFQELFTTLLSDVEELSRHAELDSAVAARSLVRAIFALIEGSCYGMKQVALASTLGSWTSAELAILKEESYSLDQGGSAETRNAMLTTLPNIRFSLSALARGHNAIYSIDLSGPGWQAVQGTLRVRHRLMHPKSPDDLSISEGEVAYARVALKWFVANVTLCLKAVVVALAAKAETSSLIDLGEIEKRYAPYAR